jgi:hypothetical protein
MWRGRKRESIITALVAALGIGIVAFGAWYQYGRSVRDRWAVQAIDQLGGTVRQTEYGRAVDLCFREVTDSDLSTLEQLSTLQLLDLRYSQVTDQGLATVGKLSRLNNLNLARTRISGDGLKHLSHLRLIGLHLQATPIDDSAAHHLSSLQSLNRLNLGSTHITDQSVPILGGLKRLEYLNVCDTQISPAGIARLEQMLPHVSIYSGRDDGGLMPNSELMLPGEPAWAITTGRRTARSVVEMNSPIVLVDAMGFLDGGSTGVWLRDVTGQDLMVCHPSPEYCESAGVPVQPYVGGIHASSAGCRPISREGDELPRLSRYLEEAIDNAQPTNEAEQFQVDYAIRMLRLVDLIINSPSWQQRSNP